MLFNESTGETSGSGRKPGADRALSPELKLSGLGAKWWKEAEKCLPFLGSKPGCSVGLEVLWEGPVCPRSDFQLVWSGDKLVNKTEREKAKSYRRVKETGLLITGLLDWTELARNKETGR